MQQGVSPTTGRIQLSLQPAPTGRIRMALTAPPTERIHQGSHCCSNREDTARLSLLLQQGGYSRALIAAPTGRIQQGSLSCSNREDKTGFPLLMQPPYTTGKIKKGLSLLLQQGGYSSPLGGYSRVLPPAPTGKKQKCYPSCSTKKDNTGFSLLL
jgi:hypothetical protein